MKNLKRFKQFVNENYHEDNFNVDELMNYFFRNGK